MALSIAASIIPPLMAGDLPDDLSDDISALQQLILSFHEPKRPDITTFNKFKKQLMGRISQRMPDWYQRRLLISLPHPDWLAGKNVCHVDFSYLSFRCTDEQPVNFSNIYLDEADCQGIDLSGAILERAQLRRTNMRECQCIQTQFTFADLHKADFTDAQLSASSWQGADLYGVRLYGAQLEKANLYGAKLFHANVRHANLQDSNLEGTALEDADFKDAKLGNTLLDPQAPIPGLTREQLRMHGFQVTIEDQIIAYRTQLSQVVSKTYYFPGYTYKAPWFSVDTNTVCHPGLYLCPSPEAVRRDYPGRDLVQVKVPMGKGEISPILRVGSKFRTPEFTVIQRISR